MIWDDCDGRRQCRRCGSFTSVCYCKAEEKGWA